jgi:hypothetical protein
VLRHQLGVLQRQGARPRLRPADRVLLAALSRSLPRAAWSSFFVSPATLFVLASAAGRAALDVFAAHGRPTQDGR